jgi:hypothetical protein
MIVLFTEAFIPKTHLWAARTIGYLSSGALLHLITVVEMVMLLIAAVWINAHPFKVPALAVLCLLPVFTQLDARSRFQEYKKVKDQLVRYGPDRRIFKSVSNSRCRRDAALAAARHLGCAAACRAYFVTAGYRWYHLAPDFVNNHPGFFFSSVFWRTTFFAPSYPSRYPAGINARNGVDIPSFPPMPAPNPSQG